MARPTGATSHPDGHRYCGVGGAAHYVVAAEECHRFVALPVDGIAALPGAVADVAPLADEAEV